MNKRVLQLVAMLMAALMLLAACGGGDDEGSDSGGGEDQTEAQSSPEDDGAATGTAEYVAVDFGFQGPDTVAAGETTIELKNEGKEPHMMAFIQLLQGKTIDDVMAFIEKNGLNGPPPPWAKQVKGGIGGVKPGDTKTAKVTFEEGGSYVAMCFIPSKKNNNQPHAALGMVFPITAEA